MTQRTLRDVKNIFKNTIDILSEDEFEDLLFRVHHQIDSESLDIQKHNLNQSAERSSRQSVQFNLIELYRSEISANDPFRLIAFDFINPRLIDAKRIFKLIITLLDNDEFDDLLLRANHRVDSESLDRLKEQIRSAGISSHRSVQFYLLELYRSELAEKLNTY